MKTFYCFCLHAAEHLLICALALLLAGLLMAIPVNMQVLNPVARAINSFSLIDVFQYINNREAGEQKMSRDITLVDISEIYSRAELADIIACIRQANPAVLGVDINFQYRQNDQEESQRLAEAILDPKGCPLVVNYALTDYDADKKVYNGSYRSFFCDPAFTDPSIIEASACEEGYINYENEREGNTIRTIFVTRRQADEDTQEVRTVKSFALKVAEAYRSGDMWLTGEELPEDVYIDYNSMNFLSLRINSLQDTVRISQYLPFLEGRIVLLGAMGDDNDQHCTPIGQMAGVKVLAYSAQTLLKGNQHIRPMGSMLLTLLTMALLLLTLAVQRGWSRCTGRIKNGWVAIVLRLTVIQTIALFAWMSILIFCGFVIFLLWQIYADLVLLLASVVLVGGVSELYAALVTQLARSRRWRRVFQHSAYNLQEGSSINLDFPTLPDVVVNPKI